MDKAKTFNIITIILMGVLLVLHFMPFWSYDGTSTSIQSYIWFPTAHAPLKSYIAGQVGGDFALTMEVVLMPVLVLILTVLGIILCIAKSDIAFVSLVPLACGLVGVWGYLCQPAFQLGTNWVLHLLVCVAMIAASALSLVFHLKNE